MMLLRCRVTTVTALLATLALVASAEAGTTQRIHSGWTACRHNTILDSQSSLRLGKCPEDQLLHVGSLPTTALSVLLDNKHIPDVEDLLAQDLYFSTNLALIPDISTTGRDYYTLVYQLDLLNCTSLRHCSSNTIEPRDHNNQHFCCPQKRNTLRISGVNYRAIAYLNGKILPELSATKKNYDGMFRRRAYDVTGGGLFQIVIEPPLHPGNYSSSLQQHPLEKDSNYIHQQGGNHDLAKDGATAQFMLGWDWCQAMPDRSTGFYGAVTLEESGPGAILDASVQTLNLTCQQHDFDQEKFRCKEIWISILAHIECPDCAERPWTTGILRVTSDWNETWTTTFPLKSFGTDVDTVTDVLHPEQVKLWWPQGTGMTTVAHQHSFTFVLEVISPERTIPLLSDTKTIQVGIRTVRTWFDSNLQGQTFAINGHALYLVGGNWISPDQALRYSASRNRYCQELVLHVDAGFNLIRVWGGGMAETEDFYHCADKLGLLVFQEFWMTGDNNGRWAGNASWPLDHATYLTNVEDTVRRLRRHSSLMFYGGCNECFVQPHLTNESSPPQEMDDGIRAVIDRLDHGRFYISSSMGGTNRSFSLACADGPYGMLLPSTLFQRNPGLDLNADVRLGFQPEIGSASAPTYDGLLRIMSKDEAERGYPRRNSSAAVGLAWEFHKFLPWSSQIRNDSYYDHVYSYFGPGHPVNASEWCAAAELAAHLQYQNLFNAFISHAFEYTTAVILWKSQSPWPSLRGFLYDWYLESTGTLYGTRAALQSSVSIVLDQLSWRLRVVNRRIFPLLCSGTDHVGASYDWIDLEGTIVASGEMYIAQSFAVLPPMSAALLGTKSLNWPNRCSTVCFLRLQAIIPQHTAHGIASSPSWHWLTDPKLGKESEFSALGDMRLRRGGFSGLSITNCTVSNTSTEVHIKIEVDSDAEEALFYPTTTLFIAGNDKPMLPLMDDHQSDIVLLPGDIQSRRLVTPALVPIGEQVQVILQSWNGPTRTDITICLRSHWNVAYFASLRV
ncbi:hypothetical protein ACA910_014197 [Epithemia clementina (nom. ined.)]